MFQAHQTDRAMNHIQNIAPVLTWEKDHGSTYLTANETCTTLFGFKKKDDISGMTDHNIPCKLSEFAEVFREHDAQVITTRKALTLLEVQPCHNNNWRIFITIKSPIIDRHDAVTGTYGQAFDLTSLFKNMPSILYQIQNHENNLTQGAYNIGNNTSLSTRQQEVIYHLLRGKSANEIAQQLKLSMRTVEKYIENIKYKFGVSQKKQLIESCIEQGYLNILPISLLQRQLSIILK